jgi:OOP family OmpA-OmpF porin
MNIKTLASIFNAPEGEGYRSKKIANRLLAIAVLALPVAANAQSAYVGASVGASHLNADCSGTSSCDISGTGVKLYGGYKFTPAIAGELVYLNFGKAKASVPVMGSSISGEIKTTGIGVGVAFTGDLATSWTGVARLGIVSIKSDYSVSQSSVLGSGNDTSTQAYVGVGVGYRVMPALTLDLSADFSQTKFAGETAALRMFGVGLNFAF